MEKILYMLLGQVTLALLIIIWGYIVSARLLYQITKFLGYSLFGIGVINFILMLVSLNAEKFLQTFLFLVLGLAWMWWFLKFQLSIDKGKVFSPVKNFTNEYVSDGEDKQLELKQGEHMLPWPWMRLSLIEHHEEESIPFDALNNIISIDKLETLTAESAPITLTEIEVSILINQNKLYQLDLFKRNGKSGKNAALDFVISQVKAVLKHFASAYPMDSIRNASLIKKEMEANGKHQVIVNDLNTQINQFLIANNETEEFFKTYKVERIKIGDIILPEKVVSTILNNIIVENENRIKKANNEALKARAEESGISVTDQSAIENGQVSKLDVSDGTKVLVSHQTKK